MIPLYVIALPALQLEGQRWRWPLLLPLLWLVWQFIAARQTINPELTRLTLQHFSACVALFYLAFLALRGVRNPWPIWAGLGLALAWIIHTGFEQHFGGLEATRQMVHKVPNWQSYPAQYLKRLASNRIFATFMYPNALAGGLLLLLPMELVYLWQLTPKVSKNIRRLFVAIFGGCGLACLYWSGSKAGWLIMLVIGLVALWYSPLSIPWKRCLAGLAIVVGVVGFGIKYAQFFQTGSTSLVARFDYWKGALKIAQEHPLLGTGPGTFATAYSRIKSPSSEMAQLCHNDYLQQASDSGIVGFVAFVGLVSVSLRFLYRYSFDHLNHLRPIPFALWLGLLGFFLHSAVEFHLYYPAFGWTTFFLLGWFWGQESVPQKGPIRQF
jgi:O-antigen ligase